MVSLYNSIIYIIYNISQPFTLLSRPNISPVLALMKKETFGLNKNVKQRYNSRAQKHMLQFIKMAS